MINENCKEVSKRLVRKKSMGKPFIEVKKALPCLQSKKNNFTQRQSKVGINIGNVDLSKPGVSTSKKIADDILKSVSIERNLGSYEENEFAFIEPLQTKKVLKRINIPFTEQIYKGLINLKITDEDLFGKENIPKRNEIINQKDEVPQLFNYYQPSFSQEYKIESEPPQFERAKIKYFNGSSIIDRLKKWEFKD